MNGMNVAAGAAGLMLVAYVVLIMVGITGAVCSIIGLVRGISSRNTTVIAVGGVGIGCAVLGVFVFTIVFWIAGFVCGTMACRLSKQQRVLSFEEFKQQKAMLEDPEYAEYMRTVHGVEDVSGMTLEPKFDRDAAANPVPVDSEAQFARLSLKAKHGTLTPAEQQMYNDYVRASMQKHGGKVKPPMSDGKLGAIVLIVSAVLALCIFAFGSAANNGMFDHLEGAPVFEQQESSGWGASGGKQTIVDLGNGTILFLSEHL
jgi:hypothetical protein